MCRAKRKTAKRTKKYGQKEKIDELCFFIYLCSSPLWMKCLESLTYDKQTAVEKAEIFVCDFCDACYILHTRG